MFKQLLTQVQNKYKEKLEENEKYKELLNKVNTLPKFYNYSHTGNNKPTISYKLLMDICPNLNENDAIILREVIPKKRINPWVCHVYRKCTPMVLTIMFHAEIILWINRISKKV